MNAARERRDWRERHVVLATAIGCLVASAPGCRSGSWVTKPSWMTFGQKTGDASALSSAPAFAGDVPKPSATAQPYPTTSTPEGYSLPDVTAQAATAPGAAPSAVTYGSTPPPSASAVANAPTAPPSPTATAAIAPQVGPYATTSPASPAAPASTAEPSSPAWSTPALAAVPPATAAGTPAAMEQAAATVSTAPPPWASAATSPAAVPAATSPPQRYADARAASPEWTPAPLDGPSPAAGRYAASGTSRFSTGGVPTAASMLPAAPPELQPATAAPAVLPASAPATPAAPVRRPDPGYRPGGTSRYRPARATLGGEAPEGVQPVSFEAGPSVPQ